MVPCQSDSFSQNLSTGSRLPGKCLAERPPFDFWLLKFFIDFFLLLSHQDRCWLSISNALNWNWQWHCDGMSEVEKLHPAHSDLWLWIYWKQKYSNDIFYIIYNMTYILPVGKIPLLYYIYNWHCIFKPYLKHFVELISHGLIFFCCCALSAKCVCAAERDIWLVLQATVFNSIPPTSAIIGYNAIGLWKLPAVNSFFLLVMTITWRSL